MTQKSNQQRYKDKELTFQIFTEPGKLNGPAFKDMFHKMKWIFVPRVLSEKFKDYYYVGQYKDSDREIFVKVRPTKQANITESLIDAVPSASGRGAADYGSYCQVRVEDSFLDKIKEVAKEQPRNEKQSISWD